ncbi:O70 family O-antigen flippase [Escherichia coli]
MSKLLKVTASAGVLTLAKMAMGFAISKIIAIYTGPSGMALLGQIQGAVTVFTGIANAPVSNGIVRYTSEQSKNGIHACSRWWRASLIWVVTIYIILLPVSVSFSHYLADYFFGNKNYAWIIYLIIALLPITALGTLFLSIINGLQNFRRFVLINFVSVLMSGIVMTVLIIFYNIQGAIVAASIQAALIGLIILVINLNQQWMHLRNFVGKFDYSAICDIGKYVVMAMASSLIMPAALLLVRNVLVQTSGWQGAGLWQAVWKISEVYLSIITIALTTYYLPRLSQLNTIDSIMDEILASVKVVMPVITVIALLVYFSRDVLISILFTDEFRSARELFAIQLCGDIIKILAWLYAFPMLSRCAVKWYLLTEMFFGIVFILLSYILIPLFQLHGANYAYLLSYILYGVVIITNVRRFLK